MPPFGLNSRIKSRRLLNLHQLHRSFYHRNERISKMDNKMQKKTDNLEIIKYLAEAVSTQAKSSNRIWYSLIGVAVLVIFPRTEEISKSGQNKINLPWELGMVDSSLFLPLMFFVFTILMIAFASAHTQTNRAQTLAQKVIDNFKEKELGGIHPRDLYDFLHIATVNRVAPLSQLILGRNQFWSSQDQTPPWRRRAFTIHYLIFKLVSAFVYWGIPSICYLLAFKSVPSGSFDYLFIISFCVGISAMLTVAYSDLLYLWNVVIVFSGTK